MPDDLSLIFQALADPTRRAILERLGSCDLTVGEIAEPFDITFQAVSRHLKVLERAGLVVRGRDAQWRTAALDPRAIRDARAWTDRFTHFWRQQPVLEPGIAAGQRVGGPIGGPTGQA